jgi:protein-disulfide isomerase
VVLAEFADFECPACGAARPQIEEVLKRHPRDVRLVFKHFPLSQHQDAEKCARAAVAAAKQNKFWEMHAALFQSQPKLDTETVEGLAKGIGLDMKRFLQDRDSEATADFVVRDRKQGEALAIKSTPSIFMNGRPVLILGGDLQEELESWIQSELELSGGASPKAAPPPPAPPSSAPSSAPSPAQVPPAHPAAKPSASGRANAAGEKPAPNSASPSHS